MHSDSPPERTGAERTSWRRFLGRGALRQPADLPKKVQTVHRLASFLDSSLVRSGSIFNKWTTSRKHWVYNPLYVSLFGIVLRGTTMSRGWLGGWGARGAWIREEDERLSASGGSAREKGDRVEHGRSVHGTLPGSRPQGYQPWCVAHVLHESLHALLRCSMHACMSHMFMYALVCHILL